MNTLGWLAMFALLCKIMEEDKNPNWCRCTDPDPLFCELLCLTGADCKAHKEAPHE